MDQSTIRGAGARLFRTLKPVAAGIGFVFGCYCIYLGLFGSPSFGGPLLWTVIGVLSVLDALWFLLRNPTMRE